MKSTLFLLSRFIILSLQAASMKNFVRPSLGALDSVSQGRAPGTVFGKFSPLYGQVGSAILYDQLSLGGKEKWKEGQG